MAKRLGGYARAKPRWAHNDAPLPFFYESTGAITRLANGMGPKLRSREIFAIHWLKTLKECVYHGASLRAAEHAVRAAVILEDVIPGEAMKGG